MSYITVLCVRGIPILSPLLFMPPYIPHYEFLIYLYEHVHVQVYIVVAVHSQDSMKLACVNAVLGTATIPLEVPKQKTRMNCMQ